MDFSREQYLEEKFQGIITTLNVRRMTKGSETLEISGLAANLI